MKINGWQRIGVVASIIWIIGAGVYTLIWLSDKDAETASFFYRQCISIRDEVSQDHRVECQRKSEQVAMIDMPRVYTECMVPYDKEREQADARCEKQNADYLANTTTGERMAAACAAIIPVPLAWGGVYLALFVFRWVRRGWD